jgi:beta-glucanase (GH16 family)
MSTGTGPDWPQSGEIDIYEIIGSQLNRLQQTLWAGNPKWHEATYYTTPSRLCDDYHVYGMDWRAGYVQFTLDGVNTNKLTKSQMEAQGRVWPFDTYNLRMLIDLQYGGPGWTSQGPYNYNDLPSSMLIDYVHVFN